MEMTMAQMEAAIEAVLFTMGDSVETSKLALAIGQDTDTTRKIVRNLMLVFYHRPSITVTSIYKT